ncbi:MAG: flavin reductase family protein [Kiritimatiellaeota bacterium]|nr:flavin reductase family protein [Kiritimatiellota bacterium]
MNEINIAELSMRPVSLWSGQWLLLTAGSPDKFNMMTVGWGSIGCMWSKPFVQVVVRPQRHTRTFMDGFDSFTLCAFPEKYRADLKTLGTVSGRDGDKLRLTSLSLRRSERVQAPSYNEASLVLECRKMYRQVMSSDCFLDASIQDNYPDADYHIVYFGEILAVFSE